MDAGRRVEDARALLRRPGFAAVGILLFGASAVALIAYWIRPEAALQPFVSVGVPVAILTFLFVLFAVSARRR